MHIPLREDHDGCIHVNTKIQSLVFFQCILESRSCLGSKAFKSISGGFQKCIDTVGFAWRRFEKLNDGIHGFGVIQDLQVPHLDLQDIVGMRIKWIVFKIDREEGIETKSSKLRKVFVSTMI